jgi:HEAT repeat protein
VSSFNDSPPLSQVTTAHKTDDPDSPDSPEPDEARATVAALCDGDFHDRWDRLRQISDLGETALDDLIAVLQDDDQDWEARWFAARALGDLPHPAVIPALMTTFAATTDDDLRQAVAAALTQIGPAAIAALGDQLAQPTLRPIAVQALARIQHPDTIPLLLGAMDDSRSTVRTTVLDALSTFADPATLPAIQQGLGDSVAMVRSAAIRGVLNLRSHLPPAHVVSELVPLLDDPDRGVAQQAAYALGRLPLPTATEALRQRLQAPNTPEPLQICLVQALAWHSTNAALDGLIQAWDGLGDPVRLALVQGLATLTPTLRPQATAALVGWLRALPGTPSQGLLRCHLVLALGQIGTTALGSELRALLNDPDPGVQLHAEAALRQMQA